MRIMSPRKTDDPPTPIEELMIMRLRYRRPEILGKCFGLRPLRPVRRSGLRALRYIAGQNRSFTIMRSPTEGTYHMIDLHAVLELM
jgi:hypothetical protein